MKHLKYKILIICGVVAVCVVAYQEKNPVVIFGYFVGMLVSASLAKISGVMDCDKCDKEMLGECSTPRK